MLSQKLHSRSGKGDRPSEANGPVPVSRPSVWSCHFLALAHHKLGNAKDAAHWRSQAVLLKDANREDAMIDRTLRREVEAGK